MKIIKNLKQNREIWIIFAVAIILSIILVCNPSFIEKYTKNGLSNILLPVFGVLLGSLITAYTILLSFRSQVPSKIRETKAYKRINSHFILTLLALWILILLGVLFYFIDGKLLMLINLFFSIFSFFMFFYLIIMIYKIIKIVNNK